MCIGGCNVRTIHVPMMAYITEKGYFFVAQICFSIYNLFILLVHTKAKIRLCFFIPKRKKKKKRKNIYFTPLKAPLYISDKHTVGVCEIFYFIYEDGGKKLFIFAYYT